MGAYGGPGAGGPDDNEDTDHDGLPDWWEIQYWGNITSYSGQDDPDGDGLINLEEYAHNTDPSKKDTDGDGYSDYAEIATGSNPLDPLSVPPPELIITVEQVKLQFVAAQGQTVLIQATTDVANLASWRTVDEVLGTGDIVTRLYGVTNGLRFFKLMRP
jgi:hypothetical protein